jgi:two-component system sensor histidine kinase BarA
MTDHSPTEAPPGELAVRDEAAALAAVGGNAALARELLDALIAGLPGELIELRELLAASDWHGLGETVHRLRGATSYCAVPALDQALFALKALTKSGDREGAAAVLKQVETQALRLRAAAGR